MCSTTRTAIMKQGLSRTPFALPPCAGDPCRRDFARPPRCFGSAPRGFGCRAASYKVFETKARRVLTWEMLAGRLGRQSTGRGRTFGSAPITVRLVPLGSGWHPAKKPTGWWKSKLAKGMPELPTRETRESETLQSNICGRGPDKQPSVIVCKWRNGLEIAHQWFLRSEAQGLQSVVLCNICVFQISEILMFARPAAETAFLLSLQSNVYACNSRHASRKGWKRR